MPQCMIHALQRFGIPNDFLHMVDAIYSSRAFFVHDTNIDSTTKSQRAGISQGALCLQCCLLWWWVYWLLARQDFINEVSDDAKFVSEIIYADDSLIVDELNDLAGIYMKYILNKVKIIVWRSTEIS